MAGGLVIGRFTVHADAVVKAGNNHVFTAGTNAIFPLQCSGNVTDELFDLPDAFAVTALESEDKNIVGVALWVVARDQRQYAGFTAAVRTTELPMLALFNGPVQFIDNDRVAVFDSRLFEFY